MVCEICGGKDVTVCLTCGTKICWCCGEKLTCLKCIIVDELFNYEEKKVNHDI